MTGIAVKNSQFEVLTPTGWKDFVGVRKAPSDNLVSIMSGSTVLDCTPDHLMMADYGLVEAKNIIVGDVIQSKNGNVQVSNTYKINQTVDVYDLLEVADGNLYYTNDFVSHNCAWLGSSGTLVSGAVLKTLVGKTPLTSRDGLTVYEDRQEKHQYVIIADVSRGKGLDYSAFSVIDVTSMPYKQVCTYKNNMVTPLDYSGTIFRLAKAYNGATVLVEINDAGGQVADSLFYDYEYEGIIYTENAGARGKRISGGFSKAGGVDRGIRTTKTVKSIGCSMLKLLVEQRQLIINDHNTIHELSRFSRKGTSYEAEPGSNDDLVMGLVLFAWMSDQQYFKDLTDINTLMKLRDKTEEELENGLLPFGFIETGHPEDDVIDLTLTPSREFQFF